MAYSRQSKYYAKAAVKSLVWPLKICRLVLSDRAGMILLIDTSVGILIWGLVTYAQGRHSIDQCSSRTLPIGFVGNPDAYGLGIRLGMYMQWVAQMTANWLRPAYSLGMSSAMMAYSGALGIAMLLLTFNNTCTFSAEIYLLIFMSWGCISSTEAPTPFLTKSDVQGIRGTAIGDQVIGVLMTFFSLWFFIRQSMGMELDFPGTPAGGHFFLFGDIDMGNHKAVSWFIALTALIAAALLAIQGGMLRGYYRIIAAVIKHGRISTYWRLMEVALGTLRELNRDRVKKDDEIRAQADKIHWRIHYKQRWAWLVLCLNIVVLIYSVLAIEYTIKWNNMSNVYDLHGTGQAFAMIIGAASLVTVLWALSKDDKEFVEDKPHVEDSPASADNDNGNASEPEEAKVDPLITFSSWCTVAIEAVVKEAQGHGQQDEEAGSSGTSSADAKIGSSNSSTADQDSKGILLTEVDSGTEVQSGQWLKNKTRTA